MWTKQSETERPSSPASGDIPASSNSPNTPRSPAHLGTSLHIKGTITGQEDLRIDGKVEGSVVLDGHNLIVGQSARITSDITAREIIVCGHVTGNLRARDRVDIKKEGHVNGDITTARITIEDGAYFKGSIEIGGAKAPTQMEPKPEPIALSAVAS